MKGGGFAAAQPPGAPRRLRGRPSGPKGAPHRAARDSPSGAALDPGDHCDPWDQEERAGPGLPPRCARRATPPWRSTGRYLPSRPSSRRSRGKCPSAIRTVAGWSAGSFFISHLPNRLHLIDKLRRNRSHFGEDIPLIVKRGRHHQRSACRSRYCSQTPETVNHHLKPFRQRSVGTRYHGNPHRLLLPAFSS